MTRAWALAAVAILVFQVVLSAEASEGWRCGEPTLTSWRSKDPRFYESFGEMFCHLDSARVPRFDDERVMKNVLLVRDILQGPKATDGGRDYEVRLEHQKHKNPDNPESKIYLVQDWSRIELRGDGKSRFAGMKLSHRIETEHPYLRTMKGLDLGFDMKREKDGWGIRFHLLSRIDTHDSWLARAAWFVAEGFLSRELQKAVLSHLIRLQEAGREEITGYVLAQ